MDAETLVKQAMQAMKQAANSMESLKKSPCRKCNIDFDARFERNQYIIDENAPYAWHQRDFICPGCVIKARLEREDESNRQEQLRKQAIKEAPAKRLENIPSLLGEILPPKFATMNFSMPEFLRPYLPPAEKGVCLYGKSGTGKTTAIAMLIREYYIRLAKKIESEDIWESRGYPVNTRPHVVSHWAFISYPEFIRKLQRSFKTDSEKEVPDLLADVMDCPYLVIDDLGAEKPTEFVRQETYALINHREINLLPTYITTNFSLDHLDKNIDPRIASRIAGMCHIIKMDGVDKRIKGK